jgi:outer membrane immunogenic protein
MIANTQELLSNFNKSSPHERVGRAAVTRTSFAIGIAALALSIAPAVAADVSRFPPPTRFLPPAPVLRIYNWTGCYLGAQLGGAFADNNVNGVLAGFDFIQKDNATAVTVGGQAGCDLQFARNWVVGAQIDGAWTHLVGSEALTGTQGTPPPLGSPPGTLGGKVDLSGKLIFKANAIATATARIGYAVNFDPTAGLFYLKGGAAFVDYDTTTFNGHLTACSAFDPTKNTCTGTSVGSAFAFNAPSANRFGWTIGLGTEWAVVDNWSVFGEWDYMNFGAHNVTFTDTGPNNLGSSQVSVKQQINVLKLGINYRFGNSLPGQYP